MENGRYQSFFNNNRELDQSLVVSALQKILDRLDLIDKHNEKRDDDIKTLFSAFTAGDTDGHRKYHELQTEILAEKRRLRIAVQEKTLSALVWVILVAIGTAVWHEILSLLKK